MLVGLDALVILKDDPTAKIVLRRNPFLLGVRQ